MNSVFERIIRFNEGHDAELVRRKYQALRSDPFTFLRGTCHLFYEHLPNSKILQNAPPAWACGDLHLENFGSYKGDNRLVYFDLNDFDEAALAPCTWDLLRLLTSVFIAGPSLNITKSQAFSLCELMMGSYKSAIADGKSRWIEPETAHGLIKQLLGSLHNRNRASFLDSRTVRKRAKRKIRIDGKKALAVTAPQRNKIQALMTRFAKQQSDPKFFRLIDVARRIAGTGSLGVERYILLVEGKGSPDGNYLLDLKQALPSSLARNLKCKQPKWPSEAHRVVDVQHRVQAISMAFLAPVIIGRTSYVLRALQPSEDRVAVNAGKAEFPYLQGLMANMGELVAWAQLRSGGRDGSAMTDDLIKFWSKPERAQKLLRLADECAVRVLQDWREYCAAYDRSALRITREKRPTMTKFV